jgi:hypothetical protein
MHLPIKVKSPNNITKLHMGFNSAFKGLSVVLATIREFKTLVKVTENTSRLAAISSLHAKLIANDVM